MDDYWTVRAMLTYGGGFVHALGRAAQNADPDNLARIKAAWPEYWRQYSEMGRRLSREEESDGTA